LIRLRRLLIKGYNVPSKFITIDSAEKLEALFDESNMHPVFLFKHSDTCGISAHVLEQLEEINGDVHIVTVQTDRALSNSIAEKLGIRHASPQAFVLKNGVPTYHATHYGIDPVEIARKLKQ